MLAWTWRTWPDPLVDFGRELYVPWQITLGRTLYRDIAYFNGPFSPYLNALWMRLLGVSLTTVIVANLAIVAVVLALLYSLLKLAADRVSALVACLFFIALFGFGRIVAVGNYNFITPYSHELTHGIALSLGALACLYLPRNLGTKNVAAAGLLMGLAFLTKVEVVLACVVAVAAGFLLRAAAEPRVQRRQFVGVLLVTALTPVLLAFAYLSSRMPPSTALQGTLGSMYWTFGSKVASSPFYRAEIGIDHLRSNLADMFIGTGLLCVAALLAVGGGLVARRITGTPTSRAAAWLALVITALLGVLTLRSPHWFATIPKALPLAMVLFVAIWLATYIREPLVPERVRILGLRISLSLFALTLLAKILFNTRLYHYGFALAMPAMLVLLAAVLCWGVNSVAARFADGSVVRSVGLALTLVMVVVYLTAISSTLHKERYAVGSGSDAFLADERGAAVQSTLQWIGQNMPPGSTLAVLPEGVMINYLSRRQNPTAYINFMPPEVIMFGEDRIVEGFKAHPPDFIVLCHKDTTEYGVPLFAHDYGQKIGSWVHENYEGMVLLGNPPFIDAERFGILILRHRSTPSTVY